MKMIDNKYKNFITKIIGLNSNLDWQYAITDSSNNNDLLNSVAFSFIPKEEKINLFNLYKNNQITESVKSGLSYFFDEHFDEIEGKYPIKDELIGIFIEKFLEWIYIIDDEIKDNNIDNILKKVKTNNDIFWLFLIKALVTDKLFASALHIIDVKKSLFLKKHIYEDLIIYEIICIRETTYLYKKKEMDKLCKLSNEIPSYKTTQLILKMECAIIKGNLLNFRNLVEDNLDYIQKLPIIHLLNIYELSIFSELGYLQNEIEKLLKNNDIATYNGKEEYNIYKLLNALKIRNIFEFLKATHLLKNYDFRHIKWYLHKKKDKELIAYLESIIK